MSNEAKVKALSKDFERIKTEIAVLEDRQRQIKETLLEEFEVKTIKAAYDKAEKLNAKLSGYEKKIAELIEKAEAIIAETDEYEEEEEEEEEEDDVPPF